MATTIVPEKSIRFDRITKDYIVEVDGVFIGFTATHHQGEVMADTYVARQQAVNDANVTTIDAPAHWRYTAKADIARELVGLIIDQVGAPDGSSIHVLGFHFADTAFPNDFPPHTIEQQRPFGAIVVYWQHVGLLPFDDTPAHLAA